MALTTNLTNYWKLDESSGNASDAVDALTLTNTNSVSFSSGKINNGASFVSNSTGKLVSSSTSLISGTSDFTLSVWLKLSSGGGFICSRRDGGTYDWQLVYNSGILYWSNNGTNMFDGSSISLDTNWHHIVITRSSTNSWIMYKDGAQVSTGSLSTNLGTTNHFTIGDTYQNNSFAFNGMIDEVGVWSRALSSGEVSQLYNSGNGLQYPFTQSYSLAAAYGSYALFGEAAAVGRNISMTVAGGMYALSGKSVSMRFAGWVPQQKVNSSWSSQAKITSSWTPISK